MTSDSSGRKWGFLLVEAVLVVLSILLAFWIDAWWEGRQQKEQRVELLRDVQADFSATGESLDSAIATAAGFVARTSGFLEVVTEKRDVSRDSLIYLLEGVADFTFYEPSLATYRNAVSAGSVDLIRDSELLAAFTDFELALQHYEQHLILAGEMFYLGAVHDLRLAMGGFEGPPAGYGGRRPARGDDVYRGRSLVSEDFDLTAREAIAAAEALYWAHVNAWDALDRMDRAASSIVGLVDQMLGNGSS
jgi:hypothetical protein